MLSLQRPYVHFLSFEIIDILLKMKLYSIDNLSNGQFEKRFESKFSFKILEQLTVHPFQSNKTNAEQYMRL